ncbi:MAG: thioredoxin [Alphaproteobacteria bacterium]|nr:thioredoxin [Alphaproteobacteria bacterium]
MIGRLGGQGAAAGGAAGGDDLVKDSDTRRFAADVIQASLKQPVLVDFWAPWCGPCRTLGPLIEKVVRAAAGKVKLVKINVDENQQLAAQLQIKSIPAVYAFSQGQPVDGFVGALPEAQLRAFVDRVVGGGVSPIEEALAAAKEAMERKAWAEAAPIFAEVLQHDAANAAAIAGLARCYLESNDLKRAKAVLDKAPASLAENADVSGARAALQLREEAGKAAGQLAELEARVAADANDHQARFDLSAALVASGRREEGIDALIEIIKRDRKWNDDGARKQLLKLFEAFGAADPLVAVGRRKLSAVLFR